MTGNLINVNTARHCVSCEGTTSNYSIKRPLVMRWGKIVFKKHISLGTV